MRGITHSTADSQANEFWNIHDLNKQIRYSIYLQINHCEKHDYPGTNLDTNCIPGYY